MRTLTHKPFGLLLLVVVICGAWALIQAQSRNLGFDGPAPGDAVIGPPGGGGPAVPLFATTNLGELVSIDLAGGTAQLVGQDGPEPGWTGISFDPDGNLFVTSRWPFEPETDGCFGFFGDGGCTHLYRLDPETGAILVEIGSTDVAFVSDIDFAADGTLYGSRFVDEQKTAEGGLVYLDPSTGTASIPPNPRFGPSPSGSFLTNGGLSVHPATGELWAVESNQSKMKSLFRVDPATGLAIDPVVPLGLGGEPLPFGLDGLEILPDGTFLATRGNSSELYAIDPVPDAVSGKAEITLVPLELDVNIAGTLNGLDSPLEAPDDGGDGDEDEDEDEDDDEAMA